MELTTLIQTLVTGATNGTAITSIVFHNFSGAAQTITVHVVPNAGSEANNNKIIDVLSIDPNDSFIYDDKIILADGETVRALASADTSISATINDLDL